jgi:hypothetical protein
LRGRVVHDYIPARVAGFASSTRPRRRSAAERGAADRRAAHSTRGGASTQEARRCGPLVMELSGLEPLTSWVRFMTDRSDD